MDEVRLPELEVIQRYSIALRREYAPAEEVIEVLEADLEALKRATQPARRPASRATKRPAKRTGAARKRTGAARKRSTSRTTAKKRTRRAR